MHTTELSWRNVSDVAAAVDARSLDEARWWYLRITILGLRSSDLLVFRHPVSVMFTAKDGRAPDMLLRDAVMVGSCYVASRRHCGMISRGSMGAGGWILVVVLPRIPPELRPW